MFYKCFLEKFGTTKLTEEGFKQYKIVDNEVQKLCDITQDGWGFIRNEWFDKVVDIYFVFGGLFGLTVGGCLYLGTKVIKKIRKPKG